MSNSRRHRARSRSCRSPISVARATTSILRTDLRKRFSTSWRKSTISTSSHAHHLFALLDPDIASPIVGRRLNVATVLRGSVQKDGETLRITAQLVGVAEDTSLWSQSFDRPNADIFEIQDEIATTVMIALLDSLAQAYQTDSAARYTTNVEAYDLYLLARHFWHQRTESALLRSIELLRQATALDPEFALAHTAIADAYGVLPDYSNVSIEDVATSANTAIGHAFDIAPDLAEAHASSGLIFLQQNRLADADSAFEKAIALEPGYAMAHMWYATSLARQQRYKEALAAVTRARRLDPLSSVVSRQLAVAYFWTGDFAQSRREYERSISLAPDVPFGYAGLGVVERTVGRYADALRYLQRAQNISSNNPLLMRELAWGWLAIGDDERADAWLTSAEAIDPFSPYIVYGRKIYFLESGRSQEFVDYATFNVERFPDNPFLRADLALASALNGNFQRAIESYETVRAQELGGDDPFVQDWDFVYGYNHALTLMRAYLEAGDTDGARTLAGEFERAATSAVERGISVPNYWYFMAGLDALRGNVDSALNNLSLAYDQGWRGYRIAHNDPVLDSLRGHPRFETLVARAEADVRDMRERIRSLTPDFESLARPR